MVDETALAQRIGQRLRLARTRLGMSQRQVAGDRFTAQYVSSLERGAVKPSMAALNYLAQRLRVPVRDLLDPPTAPWSRVEADLLLASGDIAAASDRYGDLAREAPSLRTRAEALLGRAEALCRLNRAQDAIAPAAEALGLFEREDRSTDAAWAAYWLASAQYQTDNVSEAQALLDDLLRRVRSGLDVEPGFKMRLLTSLAAVAGWSGDHDAALGYLEEGRGLIGELDPRVQAAYFYSLAQNYKQSGDFEGAVRAGKRSLSLYEGLDARLEVSVLHNHLALTYLKLGNTTKAAEFAAIAYGEAEALADQRAKAWVTETKAEIALANERAAEALDLSRQVVELGPAGAAPETMLSAHLTAGQALQSLGKTDEARAAFDSAAAAARGGSSAARRRQVLAAYADFLTAVGDDKAALAIYREAVG